MVCHSLQEELYGKPVTVADRQMVESVSREQGLAGRCVQSARRGAAAASAGAARRRRYKLDQ